MAPVIRVGRTIRVDWDMVSASNEMALDRPAIDPARHIVVTDDAGQEISRVPVYSEPSAEHPAR